MHRRRMIAMSDPEADIILLEDENGCVLYTWIMYHNDPIHAVKCAESGPTGNVTSQYEDSSPETRSWFNFTFAHLSK